MSVDLAPLLHPERSALVIFECLEGLIGDTSFMPGLAAATRDAGLIGHVGALADAARRAGVSVFYCTLAKRADGVGDPRNLPLQQRLHAGAARPAEGAAPRRAGPDPGDVVAALRPQPGDVVVRREHGVSGFFESGLDAYLRNTGARTVVLTGVSLNIGVLGTAIEAVNRGFHVIVPIDCVAGDPPAYAEQVLRYSLRHLAWLTTGPEIARLWSVWSV